MIPEGTSIIEQKRITLGNGRLLQVGALVYRPVQQRASLDLNGKAVHHEILLITSRGSGRWIIPKGWPMRGKTLAQAALREAYEEAGIRGLPHENDCGFYHYTKQDMPIGENNRFHVMVFAMLYQKQKKNWPERQQRHFKWLPPIVAAAHVEEDGLKKILANFSPPPLHG